MNFPSLKFAVLSASLLTTPGCQKAETTPQEQEMSADAGVVDSSTEPAIEGNKSTTDALNAALAGCAAKIWDSIIDCQDSEDACVSQGGAEEECRTAYGVCEDGALSEEDGCKQEARDIAGCDFVDSTAVDSDRDGLSDSKELNETFTNPCDKNSCSATPDGERDSDGDSIVDAEDEAPLCGAGQVHCGDPLRPGTAGFTAESSCDFDSEK